MDRLAYDEQQGVAAALAHITTSSAPQGMAIDPVTGRLFVHEFLNRSVGVWDLGHLAEGNGNVPFIGRVATVRHERLTDQVLLGKQLFYHAGDPRMSAEGYISRATCHVDGGSDNRVWDFTARGEGMRNTISLRGRAGTGHGNVHWTGNFDEIQDFEHDIRGPFAGAGFMTDSDFASANTRWDQRRPA